MFPVTVLLVNVAVVPVAGDATSTFDSPPPVPDATLLVRPLPVSVTEPKFRMPPPAPVAEPLSSVVFLSVSLPAVATCAIRNVGVPSAPERVIRF